MLDGAMGEGGGQILRTALSLSLCLQRPFFICNIRSRRGNPGLRRQHLAAVEAARTIGNAEVKGAHRGSQELFFSPAGLVPGNYRFDIGTAGSTSLVLQTLLPALVTATGPFHITVTGGTHNPMAPPFEFLELAFVPLLQRMGARVELALLRHGFYPDGGGEVELKTRPMPLLEPLYLLERGELLRQHARILLSQLPEQIALREARVIGERLGLASGQILIEQVTDARGPGNAVLVVTESRQVTEVSSGIGQKGIRAETVAERAAAEAARYLETGVPVGIHLADQLLLPLALAGEGAFATLPPSSHTLTNMEVVKQFLEIGIGCRAMDERRWCIEVNPRG